MGQPGMGDGAGGTGTGEGSGDGEFPVPGMDGQPNVNKVPTVESCCCVATGVTVTMESLTCTSTPEGELNVNAKIVVVFDWSYVLETGLPDCKMEIWEYTNKTTGRYSPDGKLTKPARDADGEVLQKPDTWSEVGNRKQPGGSWSDKYEKKASATTCPGTGHWTFTDEPNPFTFSEYHLYQTYRQRSGCPSGGTKAVRVWILAAPGVCESFPPVGTSISTAEGSNEAAPPWPAPPVGWPPGGFNEPGRAPDYWERTQVPDAWKPGEKFGPGAGARSR